MEILDKFIEYRLFKNANNSEYFEINDADYIHLFDEDKDFFNLHKINPLEILYSEGEYIDAEDFYNSLDKEELLEFRSKILNINNDFNTVNFHTISSKFDFNDLKSNDLEWKQAIFYFPLNDHSRHNLKKGDILFCNRIGQYENLSVALNTRGIYAIGFALTNPIEYFTDKTGHERFGIVVCFPKTLEKHLQTRNIQMNPITIDLTPYNGNRNDALQQVVNRNQALELVKMLQVENPDVCKLFDVFYNFSIPNMDILPADFLSRKYIGHDRVQGDESIIFCETKLKIAILKSLKYILKEYGEISVLKDFSVKHNVKTGNKIYDTLYSRKYFGSDSVIAIFQDEQDIDEYKSASNKRYINDVIKLSEYPYSYLSSQWNGVRSDRSLSLHNFNNFLADISDDTLCITSNDDAFCLIKKSVSSTKKSILHDPENRIYFGAPGTGKSYKIEEKLKDIDHHFYERVTFHPEFDNSSFIGGYKPVSIINEDGGSELIYDFVPQSFINIYTKAWKDLSNHYFLIIEEINRGNCAEIFGEIFQILDRDSNYSINPSNELKKHLVNEFNSETHAGIINGLILPPNLSLYATMNTSDQSLFPMDSAFKRRWDWEYIPISYSKEGNKSSEFKILLDEDYYFNWTDFIKVINAKHITVNPNLGMDKCLGSYFINPKKNNEINYPEFINKVIFYLWNDVFKDEDNFVFEKNSSYELFFPLEEGVTRLKEMLNRIDVEIFQK